MENTIDRKKAARSAFIRSSAFQRLILISVLILLYAFFYIASPSFRKYTTLVQICSNMYYTLLMAIGVTFPLITGGNDLSMGTGLICYSLIGSYLMRICGWPLWAAIIITIGKIRVRSAIVQAIPSPQITPMKTAIPPSMGTG